jgi:O-antigen/teichoic acid export membrane protein
MFDNVRRVFGQLVVYGSADVAVLAVNFLLLPVYTRVLSPAEYGVLALLLVIEAFLKLLLRWGLDTSFLRLYYDYPSPADRKRLAGTTVILLLLVNGMLLGVLLLLVPVVADMLLGSPGYRTALILLLVSSGISQFIFLPLSLFRIRQESRRFAALTFARSFGTVLARLVLVVGLRLGVTGIVLADLIVSAIVLVAVWPTLRAMTTWRFSRRMAADMLRFGLPRIPHGLLHQSMAMSDRFFLGLYLPLPQVGLYLIASSIASLTKLYSVAFTTAWMPFAFDAMTREDAPRLFARMGTYAFSVLVFVTLSIAALSGGLVSLMTPAAFHGATQVVPLLALGIAIQAAANFLSTSLNIAKRTHPFPIATAVAAAVTIAGHLTLIPRWGIFGAAIAVSVGQLSLAVTMAIFAQRSYPIPYETGRLARIALVALAWYVMIVSLTPEAGLVAVVARLALLAAFPLGLFAFRFFRPAEIADLRRLAGRLPLGPLQRRGSSPAGLASGPESAP